MNYYNLLIFLSSTNSAKRLPIQPYIRTELLDLLIKNIYKTKKTLPIGLHPNDNFEIETQNNICDSTSGVISEPKLIIVQLLNSFLVCDEIHITNEMFYQTCVNYIQILLFNY